MKILKYFEACYVLDIEKYIEMKKNNESVYTGSQLNSYVKQIQ